MISLSKWCITGLVLIVLGVMSLSSFAWFGFSEEALRAMIRGTARTSISLFVLAFTASSLYILLGAVDLWWLNIEQHGESV